LRAVAVTLHLVQADVVLAIAGVAKLRHGDMKLWGFLLFFGRSNKCF
jgi:hypothetical protein